MRVTDAPTGSTDVAATTMPATLAVAAVVDAAERAAVGLAAERLGACLEHATGTSWSVNVRFLDTPADTDVERQALVIASLLPELRQLDEPSAMTAARWRAFFKSLPGEGAPAAFLCTIFRHVGSAADRWQNRAPPVAIERIRRLNLLAAEISQATGVNIIDIDRVFAHVGARALRTDYRLGGELATGLAADTIVTTVLTVGLGERLPPDAQDRALAFHAQRSAAALAHALAVSAASLRLTTARHGAVRQTFAAIKPVLTPHTTRELLRDVRHGRATLRAVAPVILQKVLRRLPWASR
jgi:hypothetical protein